MTAFISREELQSHDHQHALTSQEIRCARTTARKTLLSQIRLQLFFTDNRMYGNCLYASSFSPNGTPLARLKKFSCQYVKNPVKWNRKVPWAGTGSSHASSHDRSSSSSNSTYSPALASVRYWVYSYWAGARFLAFRNRIKCVERSIMNPQGWAQAV